MGTWGILLSISQLHTQSKKATSTIPVSHGSQLTGTLQRNRISQIFLQTAALNELQKVTPRSHLIFLSQKPFYLYLCRLQNLRQFDTNCTFVRSSKANQTEPEQKSQRLISPFAHYFIGWQWINKKTKQCKRNPEFITKSLSLSVVGADCFSESILSLQASISYLKFKTTEKPCIFLMLMPTMAKIQVQDIWKPRPEHHRWKKNTAAHKIKENGPMF